MKIIIIIILIIPSIVCSQQFLLIKEKLSIDSVIILENAISSTKKSNIPLTYLGKDYYLPDKEYDLAQPLDFIRQEPFFVADCFVEYFFNKNDSIITVVLHTWDYINEKERENYVKGKYSEKERLAMYNNKFDSIYSQLVSQIGISDSTGNITREINEDKILCRRKYEWINDRYKIVLWLSWVEQYWFYSNLRIRLSVLLK